MNEVFEYECLFLTEQVTHRYTENEAQYNFGSFVKFA